MIKLLRDRLRAIKKDMPVYMCMESPAAWQYLTGGAPIEGAELAEVFSRCGHCC